jgi:hypothetical protein
MNRIKKLFGMCEHKFTLNKKYNLNLTIDDL